MYRRSRSRHTLSSCPWAGRQNLVLWVFRWTHLAASRDLHPFIPITGFILEGRNHPLEQICRNQHHHVKVLFTVPSLDNKNPPVYSDKRQSMRWALHSIWLSPGSRGGSRSQTSTWSGLIKAYTNRPFRFLGGRHSCPLKIKQAVCIFHSVCIHLQHSLSFPDLLSFFINHTISYTIRLVIKPVV